VSGVIVDIPGSGLNTNRTAEQLRGLNCMDTWIVVMLHIYIENHSFHA